MTAVVDCGVKMIEFRCRPRRGSQLTFEKLWLRRFDGLIVLTLSA